MKTTARAVKITKLKQIENCPALFYPEQQKEEPFPSALKSTKNTKNQITYSSEEMPFYSMKYCFWASYHLQTPRLGIY